MLKRLIMLCLPFMMTLSFAQTTDAQLSVWVNEAIVSTYTFNYEDFIAQQKAIAKYYTADGWVAYSNALNASKLPDAVQANSYYVSAAATLPPTIKKRAEGQWEATMPVVVVYQNPQYRQKQNLAVSITFGAVPDGQGVRGLAISSLQSKVITPPCKCPNDPVDNESPAAPAATPAPAKPAK